MSVRARALVCDHLCMAQRLDRGGRSALHYAALDGDIDQVVALIAGGADVDLADRAGFTPLHFAAQVGHAAMADKLIAAGASIDVRNQSGNAPLWVALMNVRDEDGEIVSLLLAAGSDPDAKNNYGMSPRAIAEIVANCDLKRFFE